MPLEHILTQGATPTRHVTANRPHHHVDKGAGHITVIMRMETKSHQMPLQTKPRGRHRLRLHQDLVTVEDPGLVFVVERFLEEAARGGLVLNITRTLVHQRELVSPHAAMMIGGTILAMAMAGKQNPWILTGNLQMMPTQHPD